MRVCTFICVNGKPFLSLQQLSTKKPEPPKRLPENESKTRSKTVWLLSTSLDKNGQNLCYSCSTASWSRLSIGLKEYCRRFKSSRPDSQNEVGKRSRNVFLPRFICPLTLFYNLQIAGKCSNCFTRVSPRNKWEGYDSQKTGSNPVSEKDRFEPGKHFRTTDLSRNKRS